jgi:hypothetical protein
MDSVQTWGTYHFILCRVNTFLALESLGVSCVLPFRPGRLQKGNHKSLEWQRPLAMLEPDLVLDPRCVPY